MCRKLFCLVIFVLVLGLVSNTWADLVAHYKFEGDANDSSGYGHNGNAIGEPNYVAGQIGQAIELNGSNQYVVITDFTEIQDLNDYEITICMWVKADDIDNQGMMWFTDEVDGYSRIRCRVINGNWSWRHGDGSTNIEIQAPATADAWTHYAGVRRNNDGLYLYIDGELANQTAFGGPGGQASISWIGAEGGTSNYFDGIIDEVRIYNYALSQAEIIMAAAPAEAWAPTPRDGAIVDVEEANSISWLPGDGAVSHNVYFGTDEAAVTDANASSPEFKGNQTGTTYPLTGLETETTYYWRIDEVNDANTWKGNIWSFTTRKVYYVDADATGANNGSSWADAYNFLQDALADANSTAKPVEIWVAQGIYTPDSNSAVPGGTGDREATFQLINGVTIKGGYAGFGEPDPDARDIEVYETILSGDLNGDDGPDFANNGENSRHVVTGSGTEPNAILDGFTITGGNATGSSWPDDHGGGMFNYNYSRPTLANCTFYGNSSFGAGGGMYNHTYSGPMLTDCIFTGNSAGSGGGMYNQFYSSPIIENCTFSGNWAASWGGAMDNYYNSSPIISNCIFSGNATRGDGGGMINNESSPRIINCTFIGNDARDGGGMININSNCTVTNSILWGNSPDQIYGSASVTYSCIEGTWPGQGNINSDPCFFDTANEDYHLLPVSPCIDAGTDAGIYTDIEGNNRPIDYPYVDNNSELPEFDMGAYEAVPPPVVVTESEGSTVVMESGPTSDDFTVELGSKPSDDVTIVIDPNINSEDISLNSEAPGEPISLVFTPGDWNTPQTVTVWAVDDHYFEGEEIAELTFNVSSSDPKFDEEWILPLYVTIVDNDTNDVVIVESGGSTEVSEQGPTSDQYTMALSSQPTVDVNIYLEDVSVLNQVTIAPASLVFTPDDWNTPQMVTVTAIDDNVWESSVHYTTISHTISTDDTVYQQVDIGNVGVLVHDNDKPDVSIIPVVVLIDPASTSEVRTTLPDSMPAVVQGGIFYVEIWASDTGVTNTGLTSVYVDVSFCEQASATELYHGTIFTAFQEGTIQPGGVDDFGGSALPSGGGIEPEWVRVGWIKMTGATVETCTISLLPTDNEFLEVAALGREVPWDQIDLGSVDLQITPAAKSYDLNGDGSIGSVDLALFADSWLDTVPPANEAHDFDCDDFVGVGDLSWFATGWMKYTDDPTILYPPCSGSDGGTMLAGNNTPFQLGLAHTSTISATTNTSEAPSDVAFELVVLDAPSASETTTVLPTSIHNITNGQTYYLEIWVSDVGYVNTGVSCAYVDLSFPADAASLTNNSHGGIFTMFTDGNVVSGVIDELGGSTLSEEVGVEPEWARLVVVEMHADAAPPLVTFALSPGSTGVSAWGRGIIPWDDISLPSVAIGLADFDHDGDVDLVDFAFFAPNWMDTGCGMCGGADLTGDGNVKLDDLKEFADNWLAGVG